MVTQAKRWLHTFVLSIALHETHEAVPLQAAPHHVPRLDSVRLSVLEFGLRSRGQKLAEFSVTADLLPSAPQSCSIQCARVLDIDGV